MNLLAQIKLYPGENGLRGKGPLGLEGETSAVGPLTFNKIIATSVGVMTIIAIVWFIFVFIGGAISIISSSGDKAKLAEARSKMWYGAVGVTITIFALFIIDLLGNLIGIDILRGALDVPTLLIK